MSVDRHVSAKYVLTSQAHRCVSVDRHVSARYVLTSQAHRVSIDRLVSVGMY